MAEMEGAPICKIGEEQVHLGLCDDIFLLGTFKWFLGIAMERF